jgi:hypothetical protein
MLIALVAAAAMLPHQKTVSKQRANDLTRGECPHLGKINGHESGLNGDGDAGAFENFRIVRGSLGNRQAILPKLIHDHPDHLVDVPERIFFR